MSTTVSSGQSLFGKIGGNKRRMVEQVAQVKAAAKESARHGGGGGLSWRRF
jgi:hypothetical protein